VTYEVKWRDEAREVFLCLDKAIQRRVQRVVDRLAENPRPGQASPLVSDPHTLRVRSGDWRILYEIQDKQLVVLILDLQHRSKNYAGR
jgi:mRNA interferase RelE/StbE